MSEAAVSLSVPLTREDMILVIAQQLTMSWQDPPENRAGCLAGVADYLKDSIVGELRKLAELQDEFEETPPPPGRMDQLIRDYWARVRLDGPAFRAEATAIIDRCFPELTPAAG
jgi:hypothetical protein